MWCKLFDSYCFISCGLHYVGYLFCLTCLSWLDSFVRFSKSFGAVEPLVLFFSFVLFVACCWSRLAWFVWFVLCFELLRSDLSGLCYMISLSCFAWSMLCALVDLFRFIGGDGILSVLVCCSCLICVVWLYLSGLLNLFGSFDVFVSSRLISFVWYVWLLCVACLICLRWLWCVGLDGLITFACIAWCVRVVCHGLFRNVSVCLICLMCWAFDLYVAPCYFSVWPALSWFCFGGSCLLRSFGFVWFVEFGCVVRVICCVLICSALFDMF